MAIDFKQKITELKLKDKAELTPDELGYIKSIEDFIDAKIEKELSTDNCEIWVPNSYIKFNYNPVTKKTYGNMTNARKSVLTRELLSRYEKANWGVTWHEDDGMDDNMSGGDYLILKGIRE
jgi:hypothetical protein